MSYQILKTEQKALEINLNPAIYGTFAEIGAGQEVARNFFQAGAAANTIAKTMSAYDKTYSDAIYGLEPSGRYVCESRLYKMLDHEWNLLEERLQSNRPNTNFFVFADTVTTINYTKTVKGQGWLGLRFQLFPGSLPNDLVVHVKLVDNDIRLQQEAIGILGVNILYAAFYHNKDAVSFIQSLHDGLKGRAVVDLVRLKGPDFIHVDNRLLSFYLVRYGLTDVAMFDENRMSIHGSEFLYRKSLMVVRGHFKPPTVVTLDVFRSGFEQFKNEPYVNPEKSCIMAELTLDNLNRDIDKVNETDFIERTEMLCQLGYKVMITNCTNHQALISYLEDFKITTTGLVIGVRELLEIINEKYYQNQDGRLLVAFGELFTRNIKIYAYPALAEDRKHMLTAGNLPVPDGITFLYKHLLNSHQIAEIEKYDAELLQILPQNVLGLIKSGDTAWENLVPHPLVHLIKEKEYFGYKSETNTF
jgi:hypothetical protein